MMSTLRRRTWFCWLQLLLAAAVGSPVVVHGAPGFQPPVEVELPAVLMVDSKGWTWASFEGVEIVSLASDDLTRMFVQNIAQQRANLEAILPADFRITWERPMRVVLYGSDNPRPLPGFFSAILGKTLTDKAREEAVAKREPKPLDVFVDLRITPGTWVADADGILVFNIIQQRFKSSELSSVPAPSFVTYLMESRTPPLPVWLIEGFSDVYAQASVTGNDLDLAPFTWVSPAQSLIMLKNRKIMPDFVPLADAFARVHAGADTVADDGRRQLMRAQTGLFIRWVFETNSAGGPAAFWKFARGTTTGPGSDLWFKECFGLTQQAAVEALKAYLPTALRKPARIRLERGARLPAIEFRAATVDEVVRVKGEWDRQAGRILAAEHAELRTFYDEAARRTLFQGTESATADPEVIAVRALFAVDTGDDEAAFPLLEAAVASGRARPRVVVEHARIRFDRAKAALEPGAKLDDATVAALSASLKTVLGARPPMPRAHQLLAEVWSLSATPPSAADLDALASAVKTMPRDAALAISVARLLLDAGQPAQASEVVETGLAHVTDPAGRRRLYAIRSAVRAALPK